MTPNEAREELESVDPLQGAEHRDGTDDAFRDAADAVDEALGLDHADPDVGSGSGQGGS